MLTDFSAGLRVSLGFPCVAAEIAVLAATESVVVFRVVSVLEGSLFPGFTAFAGAATLSFTGACAALGSVLGDVASSAFTGTATLSALVFRPLGSGIGFGKLPFAK